MSQPIGFPTTPLMRIKKAVSDTLGARRRDIEATRKAGKITADYALGFCNALVYFDHTLNERKCEPVYYNRTTSIGKLPVPIKLNSGDATKDTTTYQFLMDQVLLHARALFVAGNSKDSEAVLEAMARLEKSIGSLDDFESGDRDGRDEKQTPTAALEQKPAEESKEVEQNG
jgi:hypothetical protein